MCSVKSEQREVRGEDGGGKGERGLKGWFVLEQVYIDLKLVSNPAR